MDLSDLAKGRVHSLEKREELHAADHDTPEALYFCSGTPDKGYARALALQPKKKLGIEQGGTILAFHPHDFMPHMDTLYLDLQPTPRLSWHRCNHDSQPIHCSCLAVVPALCAFVNSSDSSRILKIISQKNPIEMEAVGAAADPTIVALLQLHLRLRYWRHHMHPDLKQLLAALADHESTPVVQEALRALRSGKPPRAHPQAEKAIHDMGLGCILNKEVTAAVRLPPGDLKEWIVRGLHNHDAHFLLKLKA